LVLHVALTSFSSGLDTAYGIAVQPDGKIVAGGEANAPGSDGSTSGSTSYFALVRYNADLTLDTSFGNGGGQTTALTSDRANQALAMALQPADGKIVLAGWTSTGSHVLGDDNFALARYTTSGVLDTTFGSGLGYVTTNVAGRLKGKAWANDHAQAVALDSTGRIVVAGYAYNGTNNVFAVARYNSNGTLDTSFNSKGSLPGTVETTLVANVDNEASALAIQSDGKIVVGGTANGQFGLVRYNSDGTLDTSFGSSGIDVLAHMGTAGRADALNAIALDSSGNIIAVGQGPFPQGNATAVTQFLVARITPAGGLDTNFGGSGYVSTDVGQGMGGSMASAVTIQSDGKIAVGGGAVGSFYYAIARYNTDGSLDTSFNGTGHLIFAEGSNYSFAHALAIDGSGNFVLAGRINGEFGVALVDPPSGSIASTTTATESLTGSSRDDSSTLLQLAIIQTISSEWTSTIPGQGQVLPGAGGTSTPRSRDAKWSLAPAAEEPTHHIPLGSGTAGGSWAEDVVDTIFAEDPLEVSLQS
jgi:uncharacterized delta-60 repeat protein